MKNNPKSLVAVSIALPVGLLHLVTGPDYAGPYPTFVNGYLIDILLPLAFYFLMCPRDYPVIRHWWARALLVFAAGFAVETAQYAGYAVLGETFDYWDYAAYAAGVGLAIILDQIVFPRLLPFWIESGDDAPPSQTSPMQTA